MNATILSFVLTAGILFTILISFFTQAYWALVLVPVFAIALYMTVRNVRWIGGNQRNTGESLRDAEKRKQNGR